MSFELTYFKVTIYFTTVTYQVEHLYINHSRWYWYLSWMKPEFSKETTCPTWWPSHMPTPEYHALVAAATPRVTSGWPVDLCSPRVQKNFLASRTLNHNTKLSSVNYIVPSNSEVIGRCGGDGTTEWSRRTDKSRTQNLKK